MAGARPAEACLGDHLRDALATDPLDPAGVYVGTRSGKVLASRDDGTSWTVVADGLPPVTCVRTAIVR